MTPSPRSRPGEPSRVAEAEARCENLRLRKICRLDNVSKTLTTEK
jgi:hypothetical protein